MYTYLISNIAFQIELNDNDGYLDGDRLEYWLDWYKKLFENR